MAIAGCGASAGDQSAAALHAKDEQHLLTLIQRARSDASARNDVGVDSDLSQFIAAVNQLRGSGKLKAATAAMLDRRALATEAQASQQLQHTTTTLDVAKTTTSAASSAATPAAKPQPPAAANTAAPVAKPKPDPAKPKPDPTTPEPHPAKHPHNAWWSYQDVQGGQDVQGDDSEYGAPPSGPGEGHAWGHLKHADVGGGAPGSGYAGYSGWDSGGPGSWSGGDRS